MPSIKVKKGGVYTDPVGIFAKKAGVYSAVQGVFAKVAGVYTRVDQTPEQQVAALFAQMSDPAKPMPSFVELFTQTSFNGVHSAAPSAAGIPVDSMGALLLEYNVTGTAGATSLTINSGDQSKGAGAWGATIQHDDGTYGVYCVTALASGTCTLYPALRSATTAKTLRNTIDGTGGQHLTDPPYKALGRRVKNSTRRDGFRLRYASRWSPDTGVLGDWAAYNGYTIGFASVNSLNPFIGAGLMTENFIARDTKGLQIGLGYVGHAGQGMTRTFPIGGASGMFEAFISRARSGIGMGGSFRVQLLVDGASVFDQNYTGFCRVSAPYPAGTSAVVRVTAVDELQFYGIRVGDVTFWAFDRSQDWTATAIGKDDKVVMLGDSWTTYYPNPGGTVQGVFGREIQAAMAEEGGTGTVTGVGQGGKTAEWGLANFDTLVTPLAPNVVVINFFVNDQNSFGPTGWNRWLLAMYKIGLKCQAIGARPVFVMPTEVGNQPQSTAHGVWSTKIGAGLPL